MEHLVGQHHVNHCVNVHTHVEVLMVATSESCTNASEGINMQVCENVVGSVMW